MEKYVPEGSLQLSWTPTVKPKKISAPRKYFDDPMKQFKEEREKKSFELKAKRVKVKSAICPVHGKLPISRFHVCKRKGKWYIDHTCLDCKRKRRKEKGTNNWKNRDKYNVETVKANARKGVAVLANWYIDRLLIESGIPRSKITKTLRAAKRKELIKWREAIKDPNNLKKKKTERSKKHTLRLTDGYINAVIKRKKSYNGGVITEKMRQDARNKIYNGRQNATDRRYKGVKDKLKEL